MAYVVFIWNASARVDPDPLLGAPRDGQSAAMTLKRDAGAWKVMLDGGIVWGAATGIGFGKEQ